MTTPDYPLMAPGGYEMYQLAQIATFVADRLARHRSARRGRGGAATRARAVRDLALAATALDAAGGAREPGPHAELIPRPIDADTYARVRELTGDRRWADVVSLVPTGGRGWAVVGHVPGLGPVGAQAATREMAEALRAHVLSAPAAGLASWVVERNPTAVPTLPQRIDLAAAVESLDPGRTEHQAVAAALRGLDRRTDLAIQKRFRRVALDGSVSRSPASRPAAASPDQARAAAANTPTINAGP